MGQSQGVLKLLVELGWIVPWTLIASIGNGMLMPLSNFLAINFFAVTYTNLPLSDVRCDLDMSKVHCQMALMDCNRLITTTALLTPIAQFVSLPVFGVLSDGIGRRKALMIAYFSANVALMFAVLYIFSEWRFLFWCSFLVMPFINEQVISAVVNSSAADILEPGDRSAGFGLLTALDTVAYVCGLMLGRQLGFKTTYCVATCFFCLSFAYLKFLFPETLPPERRSFSVNIRSLMPWDSLPILWKTPLIWRLSIVTGIAAFLDMGISRLMPFYLQRRMNWTASDSYLFEAWADVSIISWFLLIFDKLVASFGEISVLAFGRLAFLGYMFPMVFVAVKPWQAHICSGVFTGPMHFALPAISGIKSQLVGEDEQGRMQAALSTVYMVSGSIGTLTFGMIFQALGDVSVHSLRQWIIWTSVVLSGVVLALLMILHGQFKSWQAAHPKGILQKTASAKLGDQDAAPEDSVTPSYGSV